MASSSSSSSDDSINPTNKKHNSTVVTAAATTTTKTTTTVDKKVPNSTRLTRQLVDVYTYITYSSSSSSSDDRPVVVKKTTIKSSTTSKCKAAWLFILLALLLGIAIGWLIGFGMWGGDDEEAIAESPTRWSTWPAMETIESSTTDKVLVERLLSNMTWREKVMQMVQPALNTSKVLNNLQVNLGPADQSVQPFGSWLNGGGGWPGYDTLPFNGFTPSTPWKPSDGITAAPAWDGTGYNGDKITNSVNTTAGQYSQLMEMFHQANEAYWAAASKTRGIDPPIRVPFMWATDAVHGMNNLKNATLFPHNIGLGAMRNASILKEIGAVTALEVASCGMDWTFAPCVVTPRDYRWGRVYEGYSEDSEIVYDYAKAMVLGIQGDNLEELRTSHEKVLSNIKHWVGDGGTLNGVDRGANWYNEADLINIHGAGYIGGLESQAQVVMTSFNSWHNSKNYDANPEDGIEYNFKLHGSKYIVRDVLKDQMKFDGVVVTDWAGHSEVSGCSLQTCPLAIEAGNDVIMLPDANNWSTFADDIIDIVNCTAGADCKYSYSGQFQEYVNDSVSRILRMKMRAGLWAKPSPLGVACHNPVDGVCAPVGCTVQNGDLISPDEEKCGRTPAAAAFKADYAADAQIVTASEASRAVAEKAALKAMVLLKNNGGALPLNAEKVKDKKIVLQGAAATNWMQINGGWTLSWQGADKDGGVSTSLLDAVNDFDNFEHPSEAICNTLKSLGAASCDYRTAAASDGTTEAVSCTAETDICINMVGEKAYAEMIGDLGKGNLDFSAMYRKEADAVLSGRMVAKESNITLLFTGRPLYVNDLLNVSDALVAAFWPGAGGSGAALSKLISGQEDFSGKLSYTWPLRKCDANVNKIPAFSTVNGASWDVPTFEMTPEQFVSPGGSYGDLALSDWAPIQHGFGLSYSLSAETAELPIDPRSYGCLLPNPEDIAEPADKYQVLGGNNVNVAKDGLPYCSTWVNQYSTEIGKLCSEFAATAPDVCTDTTVACGPNNMVFSDINANNELVFQSFRSTNPDYRTYVKEAFLALSEPVDAIGYYFNGGQLRFKMKASVAVETDCDGRPPKLGIGVSFVNAFETLEFSKVNFFDIGGSVDPSDALGRKFCVDLKCLNPSSSATQDWTQLAQVFRVSTRATVTATFSDIHYASEKELDSSCDVTILEADCQGLTYSTFQDWRDEATC